MILKRLFIVLIVVTMVWLLLAQWEQIRALQVIPDWPRLALASVLVVLTFFLDALGWHLILRALGQDISWDRSVYIWLLSAIARYLPGGVWGYTSRAAMAKKVGIGLASGGLSMLMETLLLAASALVAGLPALLQVPGLELPPALIVLALLGCIVGLHPRVLGQLARLPGRLGRALGALELPPATVMLGLYAWYLGFWMVFGAVFVLFCTALYPPAGEHPLLLASSLPLAFFAGFVVVFIPGGLGLRESVLYLLLIGALPAAACTLIAVASRAWLTIAEIVALAFSFLIERTLRRRVRPL